MQIRNRYHEVTIQAKANVDSVLIILLKWSGTVLPGLIATLTWIIFSSALIFSNKSLFSMGFTYPFMATAVGQLFTAFGGVLMHAFGMQRLRRKITPYEFVVKALPIAIAFVGTLYTGNVAYFTLSVAFIQIMKGFTPTFTLLLGTLFGLESFTPNLILSLGMMGGGTSMAAAIQQGTPDFNLFGFVMFMFSAVAESLRVVLVQLLQGRDRFNTAETLIYVSFPSFVILFTLSSVLEGGEMFAMGAEILAQDPWVFVKVGLYSLMTNLSSYYAIQYTSSLSLKVSGCMKNLMVIGVGVWQGDVVTVTQMFWYLVSTAGFLVYCWVKSGVLGNGNNVTKANGKDQ
eukprot:TRINITY_DN10312_c1_g1_i2.p2 TRINITY_DN10312_c1_g1~~TRINITY_DN10312_c1_g1_i2.p2  ORF type:complete len:373 (+),score=32.00 TRINITY_DN10312_c1_g1_i2:89-1120(+)